MPEVRPESSGPAPERDPGSEPRLWSQVDLDGVEEFVFGRGRCAVYTRRSPIMETVNEDAALVVSVDPDRVVLAVADGLGGQAAGERASRAALEAVAEAVLVAAERGGELRNGVLDGLESADRAIRQFGIGAGTTICVATIEDRMLRTFHVGDAAALVTGQRGRLKHATVSHSPVGYLQEAGVIDEDEAIHHAERHLVSNAVGLGDMKIEVGPVLQLAARDTVVLASDGLWDNLRVDEVAEAVRTGPVAAAAGRLAERTARRMAGAEADQPAKPDDVVLLVWRALASPGVPGSNHDGRMRGP